MKKAFNIKLDNAMYMLFFQKRSQRVTISGPLVIAIP